MSANNNYPRGLAVDAMNNLIGSKGMLDYTFNVHCFAVKRNTSR